ncbi:MAG: hypothetical protein GC161_04445 [Planctomycetaceae bacterium]|nr:hypothetical protein [Planctomycetaceae bacterium]
MKQYVFLVHGMGEHQANEWQRPYIDAIVAAARNYEPFASRSKEEVESEFFEFVPISYNSVFDEYRTRWKTGSGTVAARITAESNTVGKIFEALAESAGSEEGVEGFFWSHLLDPLLWHTLKEARCAVAADVVEQLGKGVQRMYAEERTNTAHIVAHSLGTSVVHDALVALRFWNGHEGLFDPRSHKWVSVSMVANVSRFLEARIKVDPHLHLEDFKVYRSVLNPGDPGAIVDRYWSYTHELDPFTRPRHFHPGNWTKGYHRIVAERTNRVEAVHDFDHYLANPRVHIPLLREITGRPAMCTGPEMAKVWNDFVDANPVTATQVFDAAKAIFSDDPEQKMSAADAIRYLYEVFEVLS